MSLMEVVCIYVTCPDLAAAERIARALVEERLAACVNVVQGVTSIYRWEGRVQQDDEVILFVKTSRDASKAACSRIAELHAADVPCAVVYPAEGGWPVYLAWVGEQTLR